MIAAAARKSLAAPFAWRSVAAVAAAAASLLLAVSSRYGYHRDELYFLACGRHLAWGYPDQPPLVPLLARLMSHFGHPGAAVVRLPSDVAVAATVLLTGAIARELGADRDGQLLAAAAMGVSNIALGSGHLLSTTTFQLTAWAGFFAIALHALRTDDDRWWLAAGVVAGAGLLDSDLLAVLAAATAVGLFLIGPRRPLASLWLWGGVVIAILLWAPYLVWQARHGWPQLLISRSIAAGNSGTSAPRWQIPVQQLFLASPLFDAVWIAGLVLLIRAPRLRWARTFGVAWIVLLLVFVVTGGKPYYLALSFPLLLAAGAQPAVDWMRGRRARIRIAVALFAMATLVDSLVTLPLLPINALRATSLVAVNYDTGETIGWPTYSREIQQAYERNVNGRTVVLASNYGEAGAVQEFEPAIADDVYAVQNAYWLWGPPPADVRTVVAVGFDRAKLMRFFTHVQLVLHLDNHLRINNAEQHVPVWLCRGLRVPWPHAWQQLKNFG